MSERTAIYINNYDLASLGFITTQVDGWLDAISVNDRTTQLPGRAGVVILAPEAETAPRSLTVNGVIRRSSMALVRTSIDQLKDLLYRGTIEARFVDQIDRVVYARVQEKQVIATQPQFASPHSQVSFRLLCPDPLIYDTQGSAIAIGATRQATPLGTAVAAPTIRIMGAATNPVLTYRGANGTALKTMGFTVTLASTDYLEIDCELFTVKKFASGVQTSGMSLWTSGDFIALDPQDGDPNASSYPTLEVSAGTGEALYRRTWL